MVTGISDSGDNIFARRQQTRRILKEKKSLDEYFLISEREQTFMNTNEYKSHDLEGVLRFAPLPFLPSPSLESPLYAIPPFPFPFQGANSKSCHGIASSAAASLMTLGEGTQSLGLLISPFIVNPPSSTPTSFFPEALLSESADVKHSMELPRVGKEDIDSNTQWRTQFDLDAEAMSRRGHRRFSSPPGLNTLNGYGKTMTIDFDISYSPGDVFNAEFLSSNSLRLKKACPFPGTCST